MCILRQNLAFAILLSLCSPLALATNHALIVGVTKYPALQGADLVGPANDAALVAEVLSQRGFSAEQIVELSERPEANGKPNRHNILQQLKNLASNAKSGDFVYLHFAGHGSRQPARKGDDTETDGLDEIFLPADSAQWDDYIGSVVNAITDNEIGGFLDNIRAKGANVWLVFDSCHSGTMARGGGFGEVRYRQLPPAVLGIPEGGTVQSRGKGATAAIQDAQGFISLDDSAAPDKARGYLIVFSAAQSTQATPEMGMPRKGEDRTTHGVFTYNMMDVLSRYRGISYSQLGQQILEQYRLMPWRASQPLISGNNLNAPVFAEEAATLDVWPAKAVSTGDKIDIGAGRLQNYSEGARINLYANAIAQEDSFLGQAEVVSARALSSTASLLDMNRGKLPKKIFTVLKEPVLDFTLTVRVLPTAGMQPADYKTLADAVRAAIVGNRLLTPWQKGEVADLRVAAFEGLLWFLSADQSLPCAYQVLSETEREQCNTERMEQLLVNVPYPTGARELETEISSALTRIARSENLVRMQSHMAAPGRSAGSLLEVTLTVSRAGVSADYPKTDVPVFGDGDEVSVVIKNNSRKPQDVSVLYRDANYGITQMWPFPGESNRLQKGEQVELVLELFPEPQGQEDLIILSQAGDGIARDFAFLEQEPLGVTSRGNKGSAVFKFRGDPQPSALQLLLDSAVYANNESIGKFKGQSRGASSKSKPNLGGMQIYSWVVR